MKTSIFSFGQCHIHKYGEMVLDRNILVRITAPDPRERMVQLFGLKWSMEYDDLGSENAPDVSFYPRGIFDLK